MLTTELLKAVAAFSLKFRPVHSVTFSLLREIEYNVTRSVLQTLYPNHIHRKLYLLYQYGKSPHVIKYHAIIVRLRNSNATFIWKVILRSN